MAVVSTDAPAASGVDVLSSQEGGVLTLTLNRTDVLNALTNHLLDELSAALGRAAADPAIRAVVITGAGRAFSSGQDLKTAAAGGFVDVSTFLREHYAPVIHAMRTIDKPVIAAVNGVAAGAGFSLALAADLRIAAESATFVQAFVRIGLVPDAGSTFFLPRLIGYARAAEMMMLGETVSAQRALEIGLVNRVAADDQMLPLTQELAERLARGPRAVGMIKRLLSHTWDEDNDLDAQLGHEEAAQQVAVTTTDFVEGITAFLEKRKAKFTGA